MQFNDLYHRRQRVTSYGQSEVATSEGCGWHLPKIDNIAAVNSHSPEHKESNIDQSHWYICAWPHCWAAIIRSYACLSRQRRRQRLNAGFHRRSRMSLDSAPPKPTQASRLLAHSPVSWKSCSLPRVPRSAQATRKSRLLKCHIHYYKPSGGSQHNDSLGPTSECDLDSMDGMNDDRRSTSSKGPLSTIVNMYKNTSHVQSMDLVSSLKVDHMGQNEYVGPLSMDLWVPPINSKTLHELKVPDIFNNAQFRHDVIFDPNLTFRANLDGKSGKLKRRRAEKYWRMVELAVNTDRIYKNSPTRYEYLRVIINELVDILSSLVPHIAIAGMPQFSPNTSHIRKVLDCDLIIQQLKHDVLDVEEISNFLFKTFSSACFPSRLPLVLYLQVLFSSQHYGKAIKQCFTIAEVIKLDIANQALRQYRGFLVETCVDYELRHFLRLHANNQMRLFSILDWLKEAWNRDGKEKPFLNIYHSAVVRLVTDDDETKTALGVHHTLFPTTFNLDEYRMTNQFRNEYQNIIVMAILLLPFHQLAGKYATRKDLLQLKDTLKVLLKKVIEVNSRHPMTDRVSSFDLILEVCSTAIRIRQKRQPNFTMSEDTITQKTARFWCQWLGQNLRPSSAIYCLMYHRIGKLLTDLSQSRRVDDSEFEALGLHGLDEDIRQLGGKIALVADINLRTFHILYASIVKRLSQLHFFDGINVIDSSE
ncbi:T-complex protein 11-domain-containing protein [Umbelopsis sp. AD052]|nr:T-complex protein 11-domain-containing protein [Umbelopsis sp. AD052]